jgi:hypothetical protein
MVGDKVNRISHSIQRPINGICDISVFVIYEPDNAPGLQAINIFSPWIGLLGYCLGLLFHPFFQPRAAYQNSMKYNTSSLELNATSMTVLLKASSAENARELNHQRGSGR